MGITNDDIRANKEFIIKKAQSYKQHFYDYKEQQFALVMRSCIRIQNRFQTFYTIKAK